MRRRDSGVGAVNIARAKGSGHQRRSIVVKIFIASQGNAAARQRGEGVFSLTEKRDGGKR